MGTYAFLPREAVTAFLMGCPQCSTNNATSAQAVVSTSTVNNLQTLPQLQLPPHPVGFFRDASVDEQWLSSFACSTPVKCDAEQRCIDSTVPSSAAADKENITQNGGQTVLVVAKSMTAVSNKRKRTVPLKRDVEQSCCVVAETISVETATMSGSASTSSSTLKNTSNSSCTLGLTSSSSPSSLSAHTDCSGVSRLSNNWWPKWKVSNVSRVNMSGGVVGSIDLNGCASDNVAQPLDLSSSPLLVTSSALTTIRSSSSPSVVTDDFFYKRRRVRRRRVRPKRLNRSCLGQRDSHREDDDMSGSENAASNEGVSDTNFRSDDGFSNGISVKRKSDNTDDRVFDSRELVGGIKTDEEDNGPRAAKKKRIIDRKATNDRRNNNDDDYYDKAAMAATINCCDGDSDLTIEECAAEEKSTSIVDMKIEYSETNRAELDEYQVSYIYKYTRKYLDLCVVNNHAKTNVMNVK